jgi:hypothetical protein
VSGRSIISPTYLSVTCISCRQSTPAHHKSWVVQVTLNAHQYAVRPEDFNARLGSFFHSLSTNQDRAGKQFVSTMEAHDYPIYGTEST